MALTSTIPASGAIINTGDTITVVTDDAGGIVSITHVRTGTGGTNELIFTDAGGYQTGFTGSYVEVAGPLATAVLARDAGWDSSPFRLDVTTALAAYSINYTLAAEGQYPPDMQPFNDPVTGALAVSEGNVAVRTDVAHMNFDDVTFDVADDGQGKVTITGQAGGGSAIEVEDEFASLTTDVTKFNFTGAGVNAFETAPDEVQVNVPAGSATVDIQDDGGGDFSAGTINFDANLSVTESPPGTALVTGVAADTYQSLTDTPGTYGAEGWMPRMGAASALIWSPPTAFSVYQYQTATPPVGGAFLATGGGGTYSGFTSLDIYNSDKLGTDLTEVWDNITVGDHLVIRDAAFNGGGPTPFGVYLVGSVTPDTGFTTIAVTAVGSSGSPTADTYIEVSPVSTGAGAGDITGPATSTNNAIATWDGTGGDRLQDNPAVTVSQVTGNIVTPGAVTADSLITGNEITFVAVDAPAGSPGAVLGLTWTRDESGTPSGADDHFVFRDGSGADTVLGSIQIQDQGTPLAPGALPNDHWHTLNFLGTAIEATDGGDGVVDITIAPGAAPISTVFTRTGAITADPSDYDASQIDNDSGVTGTFVDDALDNLDADATAALTTSSGLGGYVFDDSAIVGAGISAGEIRFDHATVMASVASIFVADANSQGIDISALLVELEDYHVTFTASGSEFITYLVTAVSAETGYTDLTVTYVGATYYPTDGDVLTLHTAGKPIITYTGDVTNAGEVMSIGTDKVVTSHILDDAVTVAKMDAQTEGALISYDASGDPSVVAKGAAGTVLTSAASGEPTWEAAGAPGAHDLAGASHTSTGESAGRIAQADGANGVEWADTAASFNTRTGAVTPAASDYDASQVDNDSGVTGTFVSDALDTLDSGKADDAAFLDHSARHENGGADEINVASLSGRLADSQFLSFEEEGASQGQAHTMNFEGSGVTVSISAGEATVAVDTTPVAHALGGAQHTAATLSQLNALVADATLIDTGDARLSDDRPADEISTSGTNVAISQTAPLGASYILKTTSATNAVWTPDTSGVPNNIALGAWVKGNDTIGTTGAGEFDVNNATLSSITSIRVLASNPNSGDSVVGVVDSMPQAGVLYLQDSLNPGLNSVQFDVASHVLTGGVYWDLTVSFLRQLGTNWGASEYSLQYFPQEVAATTTTAGIVELATDGEDAADVVVQGNDSRLDDARTPTSHAYDSHTGTVPIADIAGTPTGTGDIVLETSPTIVTPTIASFASATHDHADAAGGGTIAFSALTGTLASGDFADNTIAVGRLANGTDGELITWSAAGVAATVGAGTSGQVLTSNGAGAAPTMQAAQQPALTKSITVEDPTASENLSIFYTNVAITVAQITAVILGSTSVDFNISHGTSRASVTNDVMSADDTADSTTTGNITTSFGGGDPTIPADSFVALTTSALSGTPTELHVTIEYTED